MDVLKERPELSSTELYVYGYIVQNPSAVTRMSINELAKETNTSTATILGLCKKYGCNGYAEFKYRLKEELANRKIGAETEFGNSLHDLLHFFDVTCQDPVFIDSLDKAAQLLSKKNLILFAGLGGSNIMCEYGSLYFSYLFNLTFRIEDLTNIPIDHFPSVLAKETCIIACSTSGDSQYVIRYVRNYHTSDTQLIAITANPKSVLASIADICISYPLEIIHDGDNNLTSQVPTCYILEELARKVQRLKFSSAASE